MALATFGNFSSFVKFSMLSAVGGITTYYLMNARTKNRVTEKDVIVVTGCDSGLGELRSLKLMNMNLMIFIQLS